MKVTDLMIKITADAATFKAATQSATRASQQMADRISKNMRKVGAAMSAAVTLPLTLLAKSSIQAADIQAKAEAKVQQALLQTGNAAGYTLDQLKKLAAETQSKTLFGDEEILSGVTAKLLSFTNITGENFRRLQGLVLDFSTQMKVDASQAAVTLGKALNNPIKATTQLNRVGITFTEQEKKKIKALTDAGRAAEAQALILDKLNSMYGGQAEAAAKTGAGAIKQMQNAWSDLKETIGTVLMPYVVALANRLKALFERLQTLSPATKKVIIVIGAFVAAIGPLLLALGSVNLILPAIKSGVAALTGALPALKTAIVALTSPLGLILSLVVGIGVAYAGLARQRNQWKSDFAKEVAGMDEAEIQRQKNELLEVLDEYKKQANVREQSFKNTAQAQRLAYAGAAGPGDYIGGAYAGTIADQVTEAQKVTTSSGKVYSQADLDRAQEKLKIIADEEKRRADNAAQAEADLKQITDSVNDALDLEDDLLDKLNNKTEKLGGVLGELKNRVAELEKKKLLPGTTIEEIARYNTEINSLQTQIDKLSKLTTADLTAMATPIEKVATSFNKIGAAVRQVATDWKGKVQVAMSPEAQARQSWLMDLIAGGISPEDAASRISELMQRYRRIFGNNIDLVREFTEQKMREWQNTLSRFVDSTVVGMFESIGKSLVNGDLFGNLFSFVANQLGNLLINLGTILIIASQAMREFKAALASLFESPYGGIIAGAAMIIAGGALIALAQKKAQKATSTVALAQGGLAYGPTLAMVGDNMNAASDPEVIAPLSKLRDYTGGKQTIDLRISGEFRTKGRDLVATLNNESARYRTMGI